MRKCSHILKLQNNQYISLQLRSFRLILKSSSAQ